MRPRSFRPGRVGARRMGPGVHSRKPGPHRSPAHTSVIAGHGGGTAAHVADSAAAPSRSPWVTKTSASVWIADTHLAARSSHRPASTTRGASRDRQAATTRGSSAPAPPRASPTRARTPPTMGKCSRSEGRYESSEASRSAHRTPGMSWSPASATPGTDPDASTTAASPDLARRAPRAPRRIPPRAPRRRPHSRANSRTTPVTPTPPAIPATTHTAPERRVRAQASAMRDTRSALSPGSLT